MTTKNRQEANRQGEIWWRCPDCRGEPPENVLRVTDIKHDQPLLENCKRGHLVVLNVSISYAIRTRKLVDP